jgi:hypothetical protein
MRRGALLLAIAPLALFACAGAPKQKDSGAAGRDSRPEVSQVMRKPPARPRAAAAALLEPVLNAAAVARSAQAERDAAARAVEEKAAADKAARDAAARDAAAADRAAADKAAAEKKAAADKAVADKSAADKAAAEKKASADKTAADKKAAADKAARDSAAADKKAAKPKSEPAPASPGTPAIKSAPASQAIVANPAADRGPDISRSVSAPEGSRFDLNFEGTGWTYLGDKDGKDGVLYGSRRFEGASVIFTLNAAKAGEYVLRFQRQDALRGISYEDRIGVTVAPRDKAATSQAAATAASPAAAPTTTATPATGAQSSAPATAGSTSASSAAAAKAATPDSTASAKPAASASTAPSGTAAAPASAAAASPAGAAASAATPAASLPASTAAPAATNAAAIPDTPEGMLLYAREELAAGRPQGAIESLDRLLARYPAGMDEAFYLYGIALEQSGPLKDIKRAYSYYKLVRDGYPESSFWEKASSRIGYIERHYFEIR